MCLQGSLGNFCQSCRFRSRNVFSTISERAASSPAPDYYQDTEKTNSGIASCCSVVVSATCRLKSDLDPQTLPLKPQAPFLPATVDPRRKKLQPMIVKWVQRPLLGLLQGTIVRLITAGTPPLKSCRLAKGRTINVPPYFAQTLKTRLVIGLFSAISQIVLTKESTSSI